MPSEHGTAVTGFDIASAEPYENGVAFGATGPYTRIDGILRIAVDPADERNRAILDLDNAPRTRRGLVEFACDFCVLKPANGTRGNRRALVELPNRGRRLMTALFNNVQVPPVPEARIDPGDGWLMREGWTLAWIGWQWDVESSAALMGLDAPRAFRDDREIAGQLIVRHQPLTRHSDLPLSDDHLGLGFGFRSYPTADIHDPDAVLTVRDFPNASAATIPRERWAFARDENGVRVPDESRIWLDDGFQAGLVYEIVYRTPISPVVGAGLIAAREGAAFLRYGTPDAGNPCAGEVEHVFGLGCSQTGRFLRTFLYTGQNLDVKQRQVFDGLVIDVAGSRRGEFNTRYGQPSVQSTPNLGHLFPFADIELTDPISGETDGLLRDQRAIGGVPKIIYMETSTEYWRGDGALKHLDPSGARDLDPPADVRVYLHAGTPHLTGLTLRSNVTNFGARGAHDLNVLNRRPLRRAALVNLDRWVTRSEEPPPNAVPRFADSTAATPGEVLRSLSRIPEITLPQLARLPVMSRLDFGADARLGVGMYPSVVGASLPSIVSEVDADGNELAGVRLPDIAAPLATYMGWNPRHASVGGPGQILDYVGGMVAFAATREDRERRGDPRLSIAERYRDASHYLASVGDAAMKLVEERHLLHEDVDLIVEHAEESWTVLHDV